MARILQLRQNEIYLKLSLIKQLLSLFLVSQKYIKVYLFHFCLYFPTLTVNLFLSSRVRKLNNISIRKLFTRFCWNLSRFNRYEDRSCFMFCQWCSPPFTLSAVSVDENNTQQVVLALKPGDGFDPRGYTNVFIVSFLTRLN